MITWMQRRKKLLVIVMWVTVIAFVGAGFVGWGSYEYGSKSSSIATVGDVQIKRDELQSEYNKLYGYYNQLFEGNLPAAQAEELKSIALQRLFNQAYLMNLAEEFGVVVNDDEIANEIVGTEEFMENGTFSKELYQSVLTNARLSIAQYEEGVRKELLLTKLADMFDFAISDIEFDTVAASIFLADKISIKTIGENDVKVTIAEEELKNFWEMNKDRYMGEPTFDIGYIKVNASEFTSTDEEAKEYFEKNRNEFMSYEAAPKSFEDVKAKAHQLTKMKKAKKEALKKRVALKKGKIDATIVNGISLTNTIVPLADMKGLESTASMEVSKPIETGSSYVVVKLLNRYTPKPLPYAAAKVRAKEDLRVQKLQSVLEKAAQKELKNFKGTTIGFVTRNDMNMIKSLTTEEASLFLSHLFTAKDKKGYINLGKKVVVYDVLEQKLLMKDKLSENRDFITSNAKRLKKTLIDTEVINYLQNRYDVQKYYEGI